MTESQILKQLALARLWLRRMQSALHNAALLATHTAVHEAGLGGNELSEQQYEERNRISDEALKTTPVRSGDMLSVKEALDLREALLARVAFRFSDPAPLDIIEQTSLERLGRLLGVSRPFLHEAELEARFGPVTLTFTGDFEAFRSTLQVGVSAPEAYSDSVPTVKDVKLTEISFERSPDSSSFLRTVQVAGTLKFQMAVNAGDTVVDFAGLAKDLRATVANELRTFPPQRTNLQVLEVRPASFE